MIQHRSYDPAEYDAEPCPGTWQTWMVWGSVVIADASWTYVHHAPATPPVHAGQHVLVVALGALWIKAWLDVYLARHGRL